jgi:hypothetical protein
MSTNEDQIAYQERRNACDQGQYDILRRCSEKKNIAEWNKYRAEHPETKINLQNADLRRASLEGVQFGKGNFRGARFEGANLFAVDFRNADLRKANFQEANLWGATFTEANLEGARFVSANLENADLRRANIERANFRGANLEEAIMPETVDENLLGSIEYDSIEGTEVTINLVDDITYAEFFSLVKCLESLSIVLGGSLPHLNEIQISHQTEEKSAWANSEMGNMLSLNIPISAAENLFGILRVGVKAVQIQKESSETGNVMDNNSSVLCDGFREVLANTDLSEDEQEAVLANLASPRIEEDKLIENLRAVTNLVECGRIYFQV